MNKINENKINLIQICQNILNKNDNQTIEDLDYAEKIISKDNTKQIIILICLKLLKKFKYEEFCRQIQKYEYFLPKDLVNKEFSNFFQKKLSSSDLFYYLNQKIIENTQAKKLKAKLTLIKNFVFFSKT